MDELVMKVASPRTKDLLQDYSEQYRVTLPIPISALLSLPTLPWNEHAFTGCLFLLCESSLPCVRAYLHSGNSQRISSDFCNSVSSVSHRWLQERPAMMHHQQSDVPPPRSTS